MTVKQIQHLLGYLGYYSGIPDGIWGRLSEEATRAFQSRYGLEADGVFGPATQKRILEVVATGEEPVVANNATTNTLGWWKDIRYFTRAEFRCPCGACGGFPAEPAEKLVRLADQVREHFGAPVIVSSGVRCQAHNDELDGSVKNSYHLRGKAMDFCVRGVPGSTLLAYVKTLPIHYAYQINGSDFVHMDVN